MDDINRSRGDLIRGVLLLLAVLATLIWLDFQLLVSRSFPSGDLAADMLVGNDLVHQGYLLHGHYSRWGFNHPGPFWFYWNRLFEVLLQGFNLSRVQIWQWGSIWMSAVLLSFGSAAFSSYLSGKLRFGVTLLIIAGVLGFCDHEITALWMPWRIVLPYFCFLVMLLWVSEGRGWAMPPAAFFCGTLIHGYITMPIFTLPLLVIAVLWGHRKTGFLRDRKSLSAILFALAILLAFATPILWDILFQSPSNFSKILEAQGAMRVSPKPKLDDLVSFFKGILRLSEAKMMWLAVLVIFVPFFFAGTLSSHCRERLHRVLGLCVVITVLVLSYYGRTPLPLFPFIAQFFVVVPILIFGALAALAYRGLESSSDRPRRSTALFTRWIAAGFILGLMALGLGRPAPPDLARNVEAFANAMDAHAGERIFMLQHENHDDWPLVAGILLEMERRGYRACATREDLEMLYTPSHICSVSQYPSFELVDESACEAQCLVQNSGRGLRPFSIKALNLESLTPEGSFFMQQKGQALLRGWSEPTKGWRWSLGRRASVVVRIIDPSALQGIVDLSGRSVGPQKIRIFWNDRVIYDQRIQLASDGLQVRFPKEWIQPGYNTLSFDLPDAKMPGNGDLRVLALRLKDLRIQ